MTERSSYERHGGSERLVRIAAEEQETGTACSHCFIDYFIMNPCYDIFMEVSIKVNNRLSDSPVSQWGKGDRYVG